MLTAALRTARVTEDEVHAAVRQQGIAGLAQVEAVVLERDGSFSVVQAAKTTDTDALIHISGYPERPGEDADRT